MIEYNSKISSLQKDLLSKTTLAAVTQTSLERAEEGLKTANKLADHKDEMLTDLKS